jgi:hypothetical protein
MVKTFCDLCGSPAAALHSQTVRVALLPGKPFSEVTVHPVWLFHAALQDVKAPDLCLTCQRRSLHLLADSLGDSAS